jgi:anthranilate synthase/aminodeoxychorismate synthase-like glutamine amidotransferase
VIDNYDSFTYNLVQLVGELGYELKVARNDQISLEEIKELAPEKIIISPGPGRPKEAGISLGVVKELAGEIPILGVCLGHQTIGAAFGGDVVQAPKLVHGKTSQIISNEKGIMAGITQFTATRYHSLVLKEESLPKRFEVLARSEDDLLMAIGDKEAQLYGLQFHPESVLTKAGREIVGNFLEVN